MAPVVKSLKARPLEIEVLMVATGQHRELLDQVLSLFGIAPDIDLDLMRPGQTPTEVASRLLGRLGPLLRELTPDWMLVQGDTTTVMASSIAAHYGRVRVGHVEAGLRTGDRANPFPEEANRVIVDHLSDLCFAPTQRAQRALLAEGIPDRAICLTGNTVVDALKQIRDLPWTMPADSPLQGLEPDTKLILVTAHRRESFGQPLLRICRALEEIARAGQGRIRIVYPVHPNPHVHGPVHELLGGIDGITLIPPAEYVTWVNLMKRSTLILTDSGGIQEEAPTLGVPVLVLRDVTERPEAVEAGAARLVGTDSHRIVEEVRLLLGDEDAYRAMARAVNPYGDGRAADRIVDALLEMSAHA